MSFFESLGDGRIRCLLCRHACKIKEGSVGICGVNANTNGSLRTLVFGHPSALHIDPIEKKPLYHVLLGTRTLSLGTVGCNLQCPFCQNWGISQSHAIPDTPQVTPQMLVDACMEQGLPSISFTYNEPTIFYPYAREIGLLAKRHGIRTLFVTNGMESPEVIKDMAHFVTAANVDLKSFDARYYKKTLKGDLAGVQDTLKRMVELGIWVEITTLLIEGHNDSEAELEAMAAFVSDTLGRHIPWHFSAFHPDYKMQDHRSTALSTLRRAQSIAKKHGMYHVYLGNVGIENPTLCPGCHTPLIVRDGFRVTQNNLHEGRCPSCGYACEGVW